jgi:hypothetical protein
MGRPPNVPSQSPSRPWVPPIHLSVLRGTALPHVNKVRQFVVPMPPVPEATAQAIRTASSTQNPFAAQQNRIRILTAKVQDQRAKASVSQKRVAELEDLKDQELRDIRETRQKETAEIVANWERKLRSRYNKEAASAQAAWQAEVDEACDAKRQAWRLAHKDGDDETSEEPARKRAKLELDQKEESATAAAIDAVQRPAPLVVGLENVVAKKDRLQQKVGQAEASLEHLTETRTEMIWLLKQVIKAEEKRKMDLQKQKTAKEGPASNR